MCIPEWYKNGCNSDVKRLNGATRDAETRTRTRNVTERTRTNRAEALSEREICEWRRFHSRTTLVETQRDSALESKINTVSSSKPDINPKRKTDLLQPPDWREIVCRREGRRKHWRPEKGKHLPTLRSLRFEASRKLIRLSDETQTN